MPTNVQIELDSIVKTLSEDKTVKSIYLFGSYAYGTPNEDSDLDIAIISDNKETRKIEQTRNFRRLIRNVKTMPMDILVYDEDEFLDRAKIGLTMETEIFEKGVKLYG